MPEFPDIKDAPNFSPPAVEWWPLWAWAIAVLGVLAVAVVLWLVWRRRKSGGALPPAPPLANHVLAMTLLEDLREQAGKLEPQQTAQRVSEVVRTFLHRQFGILARYRTTEEILATRRDLTTPPPPPAVRVFEDFLLHADSLNYGASRPEGERADALIDEAINVIRKAMDQLHVRSVQAPAPPTGGRPA